MQRNQYKRLSVEFPAEEFMYLKMACAKKGVSIKDFVTQSVIQSIHDYEDELDAIAYKKAKSESKGTISWEEAEKKLGWDKL